MFLTCSHTGTPSAAAKIEAERIQLKGRGGERDEGAQRQKLGEGGHRVNPRCRLDTAQDQKVDDPQQNRRANDRLPYYHRQTGAAQGYR